MKLFGLDMAQSDRQSVSGVGWLRDLRHLQNRADHQLQLALVGVAIAGHGRFDQTRGVTVDFDVVLSGCQKDHAADFCQAQGRFHIQRRKYGLYCQRVRSKFAQQTANQRMNRFQSGAGRFLADFIGYLERAVVERAAVSSVGFDNAVTGRPRGGGIDA